MSNLLQQIFSASNQLQSLLLEFAMLATDHIINDRPRANQPPIQEPVIESLVDQGTSKSVPEQQFDHHIEEEKQQLTHIKKQIKQQKTEKQANQIKIAASEFVVPYEAPQPMQVRQSSDNITSILKDVSKKVATPEVKDNQPPETQGLQFGTQKSDKPVYICSFCGKSYNSRGGRNYHLKTHKIVK